MRFILHDTPRHGFARRASFALVLGLLLAGVSAGCRQSRSDEYLPYAELDAARSAERSGEPVGIASVEPAAAKTPASGRAAVAVDADSASGSPAATVALDDRQSGEVGVARSSGKGPPDAIAAQAVREPGNGAGDSAGTPAAEIEATPEVRENRPAILLRSNGAEGANRGRTLRPGSRGTPSASGRSQDPQPPRDIKLLVPENSFKVEGPEQALRISYDDFDLLKILNMDPVPLNAVDHFPSWLQELNGERIRVRGFMYPHELQTGLKGFVLARDNEICCFGRDAKVYDLVRVKMREGETTDYVAGRPIDVVGVFRIRPDVLGERLVFLYRIDDAIVIDK